MGVIFPKKLIRHPVFQKKTLMRIGAYSWLCANSPIKISWRELAREWGTPRSTTIALVNLFMLYRLVGRDGVYLTVTESQNVDYSIRNRGDGWELTRSRVFERDNFRCVYCKSDKDLHCDHVIPITRGGKSTPENLVTACMSCNTSKGRLTPQEWLGSVNVASA
jgi:hypothetical protein